MIDATLSYDFLNIRQILVHSLKTLVPALVILSDSSTTKRPKNARNLYTVAAWAMVTTSKAGKSAARNAVSKNKF